MAHDLPRILLDDFGSLVINDAPFGASVDSW